MTIAVRQISPTAVWTTTTAVASPTEAYLGASTIVALNGLGNSGLSTATLSVADGTNGTYTQGQQGINGASTFGQYPMVGGHFFPNCAAGSYNTTTTSTAPSGDNTGASVTLEVTGLGTSGILDAAPAANAIDSTAFATNPTGALAQASEIAFSVLTLQNGSTITFGTPPATGFTNIFATSSSATYSGNQVSMDYQIVSSTASVTGNYGTLTGGNSWAEAIIFTLKGAAAATSAFPFRRQRRIYSSTTFPK
jgi:hypothetical protein